MPCEGGGRRAKTRPLFSFLFCWGGGGVWLGGVLGGESAGVEDLLAGGVELHHPAFDFRMVRVVLLVSRIGGVYRCGHSFGFGWGAARRAFPWEG